MDRNFFLPIAVAATIHGFLFLSDAPPAGPDTPPQPQPTKPPSEFYELPIDEPDIADAPTANEPNHPTVPVSQELITTRAHAGDAITIPVLPVPNLPAGPIITTIPPGWKPGSGPDLGGDRAISFTGLDNSPAARFQPAPVYPSEFKSMAMDGSATVRFSVDVNGRVYNEAVVDASHSRFGDEALRAVRRWRFEPGIKDGKRVPFRMVQTFSFNLSD